MEERTQYNRSGKIKSRVFALILLMLSCSLAIVAYKSLRREFDGIIIEKETKSGFITKRYNLLIYADSKNLNHIEVLNILQGNYADLQTVGISKFAYNDAMTSERIRKRSGSPIITIGNTTYIDQGLFWIAISILGMLISNLIYRQTLIKLPDTDKNKTEDLEI